MATETTVPKGQTTESNPLFASLGNTDWVKLWSDAPAKMYAAGWGQALGLVADRLQDQAAYLKQLSQCSDPAAALKLNAEFAQQSVSRLWNDGTKIFEGVRSITSTEPTR
ncbi:MAG: phasin family protein [Bradyrhizobium sp.]|uniref:phasin family protein n=1 Tax=Bradyrhizobium sp. TaxID=376 RepID=UPI0029BB0FD9|nr:phasin family protein [Bradyrhizobium sp.]MDX3966311.1 phasin family protein [Bradyrhizobium sp.]